MESLARLDRELPRKMANLDIMEIGESRIQNVPESSVRMLRKRKSLALEPSKSTKRRVSMKPRKHLSENVNTKQIEELYLNKKIKRLTQTLETIYEEPKLCGSDSNPFYGNRKLKRLVTFQKDNHYTKEKKKKCRAKIKKLLCNKSFLNRKKIPVNVFLKTIECLELDEAIHTESQVEESDAYNISRHL